MVLPPRTIRLAQFGLGPIGIESLKLAATKRWIEIVGGIDIDPEKIGRSLAELGVASAASSARVYASFEELRTGGATPDVIVHTAGSKAIDAIAQIQPIARGGVSVVSSCEELLFPAHRAADATRELDRVCRASNARVVGTGVNPGFVMDVLPLCLTSVCRSVDALHMQRVVNASTRRQPLQKKIGSGMAPEGFRSRYARGFAGHAGFAESLLLVAASLKWEVNELRETCEPIVATSEIRTEHFHVQPGQTRGLHQRATGIVGGRERITMDLKMVLDADDPHDALQIAGDPPVNLRIAGGINGDAATVAALINTIPRLLAAEPGVRLMTDLALPISS